MAVAERIPRIPDQGVVATDERFARDAGNDLAVGTATVVRHEPRADEAFLHPVLAGLQSGICRQACELRAGSRAAGRTVIGIPGAKHEVPCVRVRRNRWTEQLDMVDLRAVATRDTFADQGRLDALRGLREFGFGFERDAGQTGNRGRVDEKEPVAAPGDIASHRTHAPRHQRRHPIETGSSRRSRWSLRWVSARCRRRFRQGSPGAIRQLQPARGTPT